MKERRASKLKQKQLQTKQLEEQTKKMQDRLADLKRQVEQQKKLKSLDSTLTRWQKTVKSNLPLKSYAKQVLQEQKQAHIQVGINPKKITGTKTFEGVIKQIKLEKQVEEQRNPTKITTFLKQPQVEQVEIVQKTVLENNFFKAKMDVKQLIKQKNLEDFLQENYILQYIHIFREEGINDLEGLRYITKEKLGQMGVKAGHQIKIIKKIKQEFEKLLSGKYEQPKVEKQQSEKVSFGYGEGDVNTYMNQNKPTQKQEEKQERNIQPAQEQQYDEQQEQDTVMLTVPMQQMSLQVNQQSFNCYECYKTIFNPQLYYDEKCFCSQNCMQKFLSQMRKTCPACSKIFIKTEGYRQQGLWFCSLACCPNQQQIEEMFFQWHRQRQ